MFELKEKQKKAFDKAIKILNGAGLGVSSHPHWDIDGRNVYRTGTFAPMIIQTYRLEFSVDVPEDLIKGEKK